MGCCHPSCHSDDAKVRTILNKFTLSPLSKIDQSTTDAQFITGRVVPGRQLLVAPISGKQCVFYSVKVDRIIQNDGEEYEFVKEETKQAEYFLQDGESVVSVGEAVIHSSNCLDGDTMHYLRHRLAPGSGIGIFKAVEYEVVGYTPLVQEFMRRNQIPLEGTYNVGLVQKFGKMEYRFTEATFVLNEQVAALGKLVDGGVRPDGQPCKRLEGINASDVTPTVVRKHRLGWYEKKSLELVTRNKKMVVITDKIHMMRNINVPPVQGGFAPVAYFPNGQPQGGQPVPGQPYMGQPYMMVPPGVPGQPYMMVPPGVGQPYMMGPGGQPVPFGAPMQGSTYPSGNPQPLQQGTVVYYQQTHAPQSGGTAIPIGNAQIYPAHDATQPAH